MAVREFNGSTDLIDFSMGAVSAPGAPATVVFLWRPLAVEESWLLLTRDTTAGLNGWGVNPFLDGTVYRHGSAALPYTVADNWVIHAFAKPAGSIQLATGHYYKFDTGTWTHTTLGAGSDPAVIPNRVRIGNDEAGSHALNGRLAVVGQWNSVLSESQIESLTSGLADWQALDPAALWAFNQTSVSDPVADLTGNGADQTAVIGTTVVANDDPPGFYLGPTWLYGHDVTIG